MIIRSGSCCSFFYCDNGTIVESVEGINMDKKTIAIVAEIVPVVSAVMAIALMVSPFDNGIVRIIINITVLLGLLGFVFFILGRKLAKQDKAVRTIGILDLLATVSIVAFYVIAIFAFGL